MRPRASTYRKLLSPLLAVAFLGATGPDLFGVHDCPYHSHAQASDPHAQADGPHSSAQHPRATPDHDEPTDSDLPCTWLVDCHASVEPPPHVAPAKSYVSAPVVDRETAPSDSDTRVRGPRHRLYELHLPNAPPLRA